MKTIVITPGDINGIGPEIAIKTIQHFKEKLNVKIVFICPKNIFEYFYEKFEADFEYKNSANFEFIDLGDTEINLGKATKNSGIISYNSIIKAYDYIKELTNAAVLTQPISKQAFELAGIDFPGHTELFAALTNSKKYLMTFISNKLKCALVTIHIPIEKIVSEISYNKIVEKIDLLYLTLLKDFGIKQPRIAVLGLNPHAGENGRIGNEEINIIEPAINSCKNYGAEGPFVPDAFFANHLYKDYDVVLGIYHDQILIPFKMLDFYSGVNFTAGLPIIRTSPDHGTAFNIAGRNIANPNSSIKAFELALEIIEARNLYEKSNL